MEISFPKIPNTLSAAERQYQKVLKYETKLAKLFARLDQVLNEGKKGKITDEFLTKIHARANKSKESMLAEKKALQEKIEELQEKTLQSKTSARHDIDNGLFIYNCKLFSYWIRMFCSLTLLYCL